ncbi:hypothetical protein EDB85DRAFT_1897869 [Lactarius pseudohatsudake]|nr:hypothetical protein EDB85DRAFT_1897869 [Lactarius pseudohatsudake]
MYVQYYLQISGSSCPQTSEAHGDQDRVVTAIVVANISHGCRHQRGCGAAEFAAAVIVMLAIAGSEGLDLGASYRGRGRGPPLAAHATRLGTREAQGNLTRVRRRRLVVVVVGGTHGPGPEDPSPPPPRL